MRPRGRLPKSTDFGPLQPAAHYLESPWPTPTYPVTVTEGITDWGMCGNDVWGDCFAAAEWHLEMATGKAAGVAPKVYETAEYHTGTEALRRARLYWGTSVTGPPGPGAVLLTYLKWLVKRQVLKAFAPLDHADPSQLAYFAQAGYGVYTGVNLNPQAETQFNDTQPWQVGPTDQPDPTDGHCILFSRQTTAAGPFYFVTWGKLQQATATWVKACLTTNATGEAFLVVTSEDKLAPFDAQLVADCKELSGA